MSNDRAQQRRWFLGRLRAVEASLAWCTTQREDSDVHARIDHLADALSTLRTLVQELGAAVYDQEPPQQ